MRALAGFAIAIIGGWIAACSSAPDTAMTAAVAVPMAPPPNEEARAAREQQLIRAYAGSRQPVAVEGMRLASSGTGFFIAADRVLTNYHVVGDGCRAFTVGNNTEGEEVEAKLVATNPQVDLAVLSAHAKDVRPANFDTEALMETREGLAIVGYPEHGLPVLQAEIGRVAVFQDDLESGDRLFRFFGPVRRGNSGGPLLNENGAVAGVVTAKLNTVAVYRQTGAVVDDVGYAIGNRAVFDFLTLNGVAFERASQKTALTRDQLDRRAHEFVRQVRCWK